MTTSGGRSPLCLLLRRWPSGAYDGFYRPAKRRQYDLHFVAQLRSRPEICGALVGSDLKANLKTPARSDDERAFP